MYSKFELPNTFVVTNSCGIGALFFLRWRFTHAWVVTAVSRALRGEQGLRGG